MATVVEYTKRLFLVSFNGPLLLVSGNLLMKNAVEGFGI